MLEFGLDELLYFVGVFAAFFFAGIIKGVVGFGFPSISLGLIALFAPLPQAIALMLVPSFVTNLIQATTGGHGRKIVMTIWPMLAALVVTVWIGVAIFVRINVHMAAVLLGILLIVYAALRLSGFSMRLPGGRARTAIGGGLGVINGVVTGMTGAYMFPGALYLESLGFSRDELVQAMGILFGISTMALALAMFGNGLLRLDLGLTSLLGVVPALMGQTVGRRMRSKISEREFRRIFLGGVAVLGAYILIRALTSLAQAM